MLADLTLIPVGGDSHTSSLLADILKTVSSSGIAYQLTPTATCIEGTWDEITDVARQCHEVARRNHSHVITLLRIEDDGTEQNKLFHNTDSVEKKAGQRFNKEPDAYTTRTVH